MLGFLLKVVCYTALIGFLGWFVSVAWKLITGKAGRLPWL